MAVQLTSGYARLLFAAVMTLTMAILSAQAQAGASTADHTTFKELQQPFESGPAVTQACLKCHTEAAHQVMKTPHWTWEFLNPATQQKLGKQHVLNNFCISVESNYAFCTTCHAGYGWKDHSFDFTKQENVDCLVCHDTTGKYRKQPGTGGLPPLKAIEWPPGSGKIVRPVDLQKVAQNVGKTSRDTCGACHFFGGGGDGVKHGDMDSSLAAPEANIDIHMDATGLDFICSSCHQASGHRVPGSRYAPTARDDKGKLMRGKESGRNPATCQSCHGTDPHKSTRLNSHADKIACQTCHIPKYARGGVPTKMGWDWSTAGQKGPDGKPLIKKDAKGHVIYDAKKGDFIVAENVVPEYKWFNGTVSYTLLGAKIDNSKVVPINAFEGGPDDGKSLIWPVKVMRGKQPYDPVNKTLVKPHTAGDDSTAYWKNFGWEKAIAAGMAETGLPFSGKVDFVETEMAWPITHMVAAKDESLGCVDCHGANSRLAGLPGIYMPGHSASRLLDTAGWGLAALCLVGVIGHGGIRILAARKGSEK
ncbi:MAG: cytochrome c family protein [bacterium]|nr:MAG: cytochrome c family protein [bacterium]KAF0149660.1 MAG: cytochrome c family protein [bacterium]KAF0169326.1 MAG: cytochrome c family protein [bacterium]TXT21400.1 MAG: cytochrome c family protein [bacterium]